MNSTCKRVLTIISVKTLLVIDSILQENIIIKKNENNTRNRHNRW